MTYRPHPWQSIFILALSLMLAIPSVSLALVWAETGDAGDLVGTAQVTSGAGTLSNITGSISILPDNVDMYCISIPDPNNFYAVILCTNDADPDLWLFDQDGNGVTMEDVCGAGAIALTPDFVNAPGPYFLAISASDDEAQSTSGSIWAAGSAAAQRVPDGPGAGDPLTGWTNTMPLPMASYSISLIGAETCDGVVTAEKESWGAVKSIYR